MKVIKTKAKRPKGEGFLYRGKTTILEVGSKRGQFVQNETYIIPHYTDDDHISLTIKTPTKVLEVDNVTRDQFQALVGSGRSSYKDADPYLK